MTLRIIFGIGRKNHPGPTLRMNGFDPSPDLCGFLAGQPSRTPGGKFIHQTPEGRSCQTSAVVPWVDPKNIPIQTILKVFKSPESHDGSVLVNGRLMRQHEWVFC